MGVWAIVMAVATSMLAAEVAAYGPNIARWAIRHASKWKPHWEQQDYVDEMADHIDDGCMTPSVPASSLMWT